MRKRGRFDFHIEKLCTNDQEQTFTAAIVPDPRRYTKVDKDGEVFYLDKFLQMLVPWSEMRSQIAGLPIFHLSPSIDSTPEYANRRLAVVSKEIQGEPYEPPPEKATQHHEFEGDQTRDLAFLSVDICGSTAYRRKNPDGFEKAHQLLIRELGTLVGQFQGSLLKLTGDGFIAYIDHPSTNSLCDATVDLGLSLITLTNAAINPALSAGGLDPISIRVGADFGEASVRTVSIPTTGYKGVEVASDALNRAVKIEQTCSPNQFRIGRELYELIHVAWLMRSSEVSFDGSAVGMQGYKVYALE